MVNFPFSMQGFCTAPVGRTGARQFEAEDHATELRQGLFKPERASLAHLRARRRGKTPRGRRGWGTCSNWSPVTLPLASPAESGKLLAARRVPHGCRSPPWAENPPATPGDPWVCPAAAAPHSNSAPDRGCRTRQRLPSTQRNQSRPFCLPPRSGGEVVTSKLAFLKHFPKDFESSSVHVTLQNLHAVQI